MGTLSSLARVKRNTWVQQLPGFNRFAEVAPCYPVSLGYQAPIAMPEPVEQLRLDIAQCQLLGETFDGYKILCYQHQGESVLMREIGRLRELTFRQIGEGSGRSLDIDHFDDSYDHLVLWDEANTAIVGAYRMRAAAGTSWEWPSLYSQTLFKLKPAFQPYLDQGLELGRSFVQPAYQGRRSLDYLWQGIGAYVSARPGIRYLFGPVSISQCMPEPARQLLVAFFEQWFPCNRGLVKACRPFKTRIGWRRVRRYSRDYRSALAEFREEIKAEGGYIPPLYKQYTEAFEAGGVQFAAFNLDPDFANCVDGLIVADLHYLKAQKRQRYLRV